MSVIRYINNSDTSVVVGDNTVPAWDQLISAEQIAELDAINLNTFVVLVNGVQIEPAVVVPTTGKHVPPVFIDPGKVNT